MKKILCFLILAMMGANAFAAPPQKPNCKCSDCKCTKESHCGCMKEPASDHQSDSKGSSN